MESRLNDLLRACQKLIRRWGRDVQYGDSWTDFQEAVKAAELEAASSSVQQVAPSGCISGAGCEVGEGYRRIAMGEVLLPGDEYLHSSVWLSTLSAGLHLDQTEVPYRRKIEPTPENPPTGATTPMGDATGEEQTQVSTDSKQLWGWFGQGENGTWSAWVDTADEADECAGLCDAIWDLDDSGRMRDVDGTRPDHASRLDAIESRLSTLEASVNSDTWEGEVHVNNNFGDGYLSVFGEAACPFVEGTRVRIQVLPDSEVKG